MSNNQEAVVYTEEFRGPNKEVRVLSAFCYIPGIGIFTPNFLDSTMKNPNSAQVSLSENEFVRFHLVQAYVLFGIFIIGIVLPFINFFINFLVYLLLTGIHGYYAYKGEAFRLWGIQRLFPVDDKIIAMSVKSPVLLNKDKKKQNTRLHE